MTVLVLNGDYRPLHVCSIRRAVVLLLKEKAEVVEELDDRLVRAESLTLAYPAVIRLIVFVRIPRLAARGVSRRAVYARDSQKCQYCGSSSRLTLDHVVPRSRGGQHVWDNVVTSCEPCNNRKGARLPREAGMKLRTQPRVPAPMAFALITVRKIPESWEPWLPSKPEPE